MAEPENELSKLRWHCRRGVKELDVVLTKYLENHYPSAGSTSKNAFKRLLQIEDPELLSLVMGYHQSDDPEQNAVLDKMRSLFKR